MMKTNAGIYGNGEVGQAISGLYDRDRKPYIRDLGVDDFPDRLDYVHICTPWTKRFVSDVVSLIEEKRVEVAIIHSTVPVGTTREIGPKAVHSPIRGRHPELLQSVRTFIKYVGYDDMQTGALACKHLTALDVPVTAIAGSATTELLKLLDTAYYAVCIAFHGYAHELCEKTGADFRVAMTDANESYNRGYAELGYDNFRRPVLDPPGKKIGGHCLIPNAEILREQFGGNGFIDEVLKYK